MSVDTENLVTYDREGHIGRITLNRPEKRNALNPDVWKALDLAVDRATEDREARVVVVAGAGPSFCAGLDLSPENELFAKVLAKPSASQKVEFYDIVRWAQEVYNRLENLYKPTLALIQGHCLGAGLELALCCDMRLCTNEAQFGLPEAKLALITDVGGLQRLQALVGRAHAREIAFRAHRFDAKRAESIGLVNYAFEDEAQMIENACVMAEEIASNPPLAVWGAKEVMLFDQGAPMRHSLEYNAARSAMILPSEDQEEAIKAYFEKRKGCFKGA